MFTEDWMQRLARMRRGGRGLGNFAGIGTAAPRRTGQTNVAYIWSEATRLRRKPWELPGLRYLRPPSIGHAVARANANPLGWLRSLDEALRAGMGHDPTNGLRAIVGRSPALLPFSDAERAIWHWAWRSVNEQGRSRGSPTNTAMWVLNYQRDSAAADALQRGVTEQQAQQEGQEAVNRAYEPARQELTEASRQAMATTQAIAQARIRRLEAQQNIIRTLAPQNALPSVARGVTSTVTGTVDGILGPLKWPLIVGLGLGGVLLIRTYLPAPRR